MGRSKDTRAISRDIVRTEASPQSRSRRSPAAHHAPCSPLGSPRTMKSREHKLDICFDFTRGSCRRGDGCRFSHNLPPGGVIPPRPKTAGVCFDYTKGICNRGCVSRRSRRPRRDLRRDLARPVTRERRRIKKRERFLTIDACSFSRSDARRDSLSRSSLLRSPSRDRHHRDACRFSHDAQAVAAFAKREESGGSPTSSKALPKPLQVPAAKKTPAASSGSLGAPRRTGEPSHAIASNAKHAKHVGPAANANASRRDDPGSIAKTNAPASPARTNGNGNPWASVAGGGAPALSSLSAPRRDGAATREAPSFRFGAFDGAPKNAPFGNEIEKVVSSSESSSLLLTKTPNVSRPNFSFGSGTASYGAESNAGSGPSLFGPVPAVDDAGDVRGGAVGYEPETAPRGFGNGGARESGPPGLAEHLGVGSPPRSPGGGWEVCSEGTERPSSGTRSGRARRAPAPAPARRPCGAAAGSGPCAAASAGSARSTAGRRRELLKGRL